jgi:hypothetical protein
MLPERAIEFKIEL